MLKYKIIKRNDKKTLITNLQGKALLNIEQLNKDTAFSYNERRQFKLLGKLPAHVENLETQIERAYLQFSNHTTRLDKYIFLNTLHDKNQVLFYKLLKQNLAEMLPIVYTPTVSTAVKIFSQKFRKPRGLYISYDNINHIDEILNNRSNTDIKVIVVTDGEGVLGIGDQGIGSMDIPIAKLAVISALGGVNPDNTLAITLDVGTNNQKLLKNNLYLGLRHNRIHGNDYDKFISLFVAAIKRQFPNCLLQWEDFGRNNAARILTNYRYKLCTFNDDIQGTGVVVLAALIVAMKIKKQQLKNQRIVIFGGGSAGMGIAKRLHGFLCNQGLTNQQAINNFWIVDKEGLICIKNNNLTTEQKMFARKDNLNCLTLECVIDKVQPHILIGTSGVLGSFNETIIRKMKLYQEQPIVMPLSNPMANCEAHPADILNWTESTALIATGSPFEDCKYNNKKISIPQCNNALIFPALAFAHIIVEFKYINDDLLNQAAIFLAKHTNSLDNTLLPKIFESEKFLKKLVQDIILYAMNKNCCNKYYDKQELPQIIAKYSWQPEYLDMEYCKEL